MDDALLAVVFDRLSEANLDPLVESVVLGACAGDQELADALGGEVAGRPEIAQLDATAEPAGAYLSRVTVEGFRGIGPPQTLELTPGPGLTLVIGRNGSGKSSFVEALELLLTGNTRRWADRPKVWKDGWRNLHHSDHAAIEAELVVDGHSGSTVVTSTWAAGAELGAAKTRVQAAGARETKLSTLGWDAPLASYRPFLTHNELGSLLEEGPSRLYDAMFAILGLSDLVDAQQRLANARKALDEQVKLSKAQATLLAQDLAGLDDERARQCHLASTAKTWDLEKIAGAIAGATGGEDADLDLLHRLARIDAAPLDAVDDAANEARAAADALDAVAGTEAERASRIADLLEGALEHHEHVGEGPCPICGTGTLDETWQSHAQAELSQLRDEAATARAAIAAVEHAWRALRALTPPVPDALVLADDVGIEAAHVRLAWDRLRELPDDLRAAGDHVNASYAALTEALDELHGAAQAALEHREELWTPLAVRLAGWLDGAALALVAAERLQPLKKAEQWMKGAADEIRNLRLAPLAHQSAEVWSALRQQSNVDLGPIRLEGSGTARRVALNVTIDGVDGAALSVMSQGELYAMALALFLPRATAPESPFRFLVIDDPVQAMDPAKVDGLARVLEDVARRRQVVVFTHDDRLPESLRRLQVPATVVQVTRRPGSIVEVAVVEDPAQRYINDAMAIAKTDELPELLRRRVVPGFARLAIEAVLSDVARRKLFRKGLAHEDVEQQVDGCNTLNKLAALALFEDESKAGEVLARLGMYKKPAVDAFRIANRGAHEGYDGNLVDFVRDAEGLVNGLRRQQ